MMPNRSPMKSAAASRMRRGGAATSVSGSAGATIWALSSGSLRENSTVSRARAFAALAARRGDGSRTRIVTLPVSLTMFASVAFSRVFGSSPSSRATRRIVAGAFTYSEYFGPMMRTTFASETSGRGAIESSALPSYCDGSVST